MQEFSGPETEISPQCCAIWVGPWAIDFSRADAGPRRRAMAEINWSAAFCFAGDRTGFELPGLETAVLRVPPGVRLRIFARLHHPCLATQKSATIWFI